ncbi:C-terminal binding protein [Adhaeribacter pallidiroseus]|uniref:Phosphoglycerate dehydrogenase n=1 Tax=Adhaeribacter pallidiroseus TaxID=2072847 RepID=A0A369QFD7_9BACT|nr:C-terminal binding protein [Adhaeribacter pallidiroseus]RDC63623.1 Phosphoglycerate dehydrogenase [Adhaeribacter pallidiroseus]
MSKKYRVVITDFLSDSLETETKILNNLADVVALNAFSEEDLMGKIEEADAVILYHLLTISKNTIARLKNCRLIVRAGVGIDNVDYRYARTCNIPVVNIPDYGSEDVADTAMGMLLSLMRGVHFLNSRLRAGQGEWSYTQVQPLRRLRGCSLGIIGLGRIGTAMALRAKSLGMEVSFYDPYKPDGYDKALGIKRVETLPELLEKSQVVSLHCPLTEETQHLINACSLAYMAPGAYLINTARGAVVDTSIIPEALVSGQLAGAALDVLEQEPPGNNPLIQAWQDPQHSAHHRLILNPHAAFYSEEGLAEIRVRSAQACLNALAGKPLRNVIN